MRLSKPRRKVVVVRLPIEVAGAIRLIARRAGTSQTTVVNVLLAAALLRLEKSAPDRDAVRRAQAR